MKFLSVFILVIIISSCTPSSTTKEVNSYHKESKIISDPYNPIIDTTETIKLNYILWGCNCPNWVNPKLENDSNLIDHCIYIEPSNDTIKTIDSTFDISTQQIIITGSFLKNLDYPKGTVQEEEHRPKAKVFRYNNIQIVNKQHTTHR